MTPKRPLLAARPGWMRYSAVELLVTLALLLFSTPFVHDLPHGNLIEVIIFTFVLISSVIAIGARGLALWIATVLSAISLGIRWMHHFLPESVPLWISQISSLIFLTYVVIQLLRFAVYAPQVNSEVMCAAISAYLLMGLIWAISYMLIAHFSPGAFSITGAEPGRSLDNFNAIYFSFVVLSTIGFGDIAPVSKFARMLSVLEAITGMFYIAVLISRLVAMYTPSNRSKSRESTLDATVTSSSTGRGTPEEYE